MFANALLECAPNLQARRRWTLLLSLTLQVSAVSLVLFYPLFHPEHLPLISTVPKIALSVPYVRVVPTANDGARSTAVSRLEWPQTITIRHSDPSAVTRTEPNDLPPGPTVPFAIEANPTIGIPANIFAKGPAVVRRDSTPANTKPVRRSHMEEGRLLQKVQPLYPPTARQMQIQGEVVLTALIARDGTIEGLRATSGHPLLIPAAIQAVSQWRYKPYILNGSATEVETTIRVNFRLEQ